MAPDYLFPNEPSFFTPDQLNRLLVHCYQKGASDITIQSGEPVFIEVDARLMRATKRPISLQETQDVINHIYGPNASALIFSGTDIDTNYRVKNKNAADYRFRVNVTPCIFDGYQGIQVTLRTISGEPPPLSKMDLEEGLYEHLTLPQGVMVVSGATGSGKSTLLASIIAELVQRENSNLKVLTYESPIEYVYDRIQMPSSIVSQTEIPRYLPSFAAGVRNALRRKPGLILVGEARDKETIEAVIDAAMTGHPVYTTVHSNGVPDTLRRMATIFPYAERDTRFFDLLETIKVVIWQALVPTPEGRRTPIREYLVLNGKIRDLLLEVAVEDIVAETRKLVHLYGQPIYESAKKKFLEGKITEAAYRRFAKTAPEGWEGAL